MIPKTSPDLTVPGRAGRPGQLQDQVQDKFHLPVHNVHDDLKPLTATSGQRGFNGNQGARQARLGQRRLGRAVGACVPLGRRAGRVFTMPKAPSKSQRNLESVIVYIGTKIAKWTGLAEDESAKRRYLGGMKPDKYFDEVVYPDLKETFSILGFKYDKGKEVRLLYRARPRDGDSTARSSRVGISGVHHHRRR